MRIRSRNQPNNKRQTEIRSPKAASLLSNPTPRVGGTWLGPDSSCLLHRDSALYVQVAGGFLAYFLCKRYQRRTADPARGPIVHQDRAERFVEFDRRRVPVQHRPLQPRPAIRHALPGKMYQQCLADTLAAVRRTHEQVFQIDPGAAAEGRKIDEPDRETGRLALPFRDLAEQPWTAAEQRRADASFGGFDFVQQLFVLGEFANQRQNQSGFIGTRAADNDGHSIAHTATSALMCGCGS